MVGDTHLGHDVLVVCRRVVLANGWIPRPTTGGVPVGIGGTWLRSIGGGDSDGIDGFGYVLGMVGGPGTGVGLGAGPCIRMFTPWGMLPIRTMVGSVGEYPSTDELSLPAHT